MAMKHCSIFHIKLIAHNEDICSSVIITWMVCYSACAKVLCFTITNNLVPRVRVLCPAERATGTSEIISFNSSFHWLTI